MGLAPFFFVVELSTQNLGSLGRCHRLPLDDLLGDQIRTANLTDTELRFLIEILGARPRGLSAKASVFCLQHLVTWCGENGEIHSKVDNGGVRQKDLTSEAVSLLFVHLKAFSLDWEEAC